MKAMIDIYHDEIVAAIAANDTKWLATIAGAFCERCHYYKPWKIESLRSQMCPLDGLQAHVGIEFDDGSKATVSIGYRHGKRRLTVNGDEVCCESSADVVHVLQVPCAFFDGIYYAIEGLAEIARGEIKQQIIHWDGEAKQSLKNFHAYCDMLGRARADLERLNNRVTSAAGRLATIVENRHLVGSKRTWTICPVDFESRLAEAHAFLPVPITEFVSLRDAKQRLWGKSGVYFGWRVTDGKCVYVGKSENLGSRLHPKREELLDCKITYLEMPAEHVHTWELFFIWLHQPERNREVREAMASVAKCRGEDVVATERA